MQIIIFPTDDNRVAVLSPAPDMDILAIAEKDVPEGKPWRIIDSDDLPAADAWLWSDEGPIQAAPSAPGPIPDLSFAQLLIGLVSEGWITEAEGESWLAGTLPAPVTALISTLPVSQQFATKARAMRPSVVMRADPLVASLGTAQGKTAAELDAFFVTYSQV